MIETATAKYVLSIKAPHISYYNIIDVDTIVDCGNYYEVIADQSNLFIDKDGCEVEESDGLIKILQNDSILLSLMV